MGAAAMVKRLMPKSLFGRALLIIVTPLILLQVVSTWIFYDRHWETITRRLAGAAAGEIAMVIEQLDGRTTTTDTAAVAIAAKHLGLRIRLRPGDILPNTEPIIGTGILDRLLRRELTNRLRRPFVLDTDHGPRSVQIEVQLRDGVLEVIVPRERLFSSTTYIFVLWMVGTSLVLFAVASIFMRNQVRPIRRLARAVDSFGKGRGDETFRPAGASEVRQAAAAFNVMRERIQRMISQRTDMLAGVSHDLRTPLTRMKLQLAMLEDRPEIADLKADISEMEQMLDEYLAFAKGEGAESVEPVNIVALVGEVVSASRRQGAEIHFEADEPITVPLRLNAMRRCLTNIVANAIKYARHIAVTARRAGEAVEIVVDDDGPGIPSDQREEVFRPFHRIDPSRSRETGGSGLGLTIARDVMRSHGGDVTLGDAPGGGLRVTLRMPI